MLTSFKITLLNTEQIDTAVTHDTQHHAMMSQRLSSAASRLQHCIRPASAANASIRSFSAQQWHGTTILCVRKDGKVCMIGDGQVSMGNMVVKPNAQKIRRIEQGGKKGDDDENGTIITGFAGSTADAFTLLERLEQKLDEYPGQLTRACVELAKAWRTDKYLRRLEASLLVADSKVSFELTGNGDVLSSNDGVLSVGSGSPFALAAARALIDQTGMDSEQIARKSMDIASDMCVYTNKHFMVEVLDADPVVEDGDDSGVKK